MNMVRRRVMLLGFGLLVLVVGELAVAAEAGSWVGAAPALSVASADRHACSQPLLPPPLAAGGRLAGVRWRFQLPPGARLQARLCHPQRCIDLPAAQGASSALSGLDAAQPLQLCFRLQPGEQPLRVGGLQLLVDYRP
jgi:flagellar protein FlhE